jgi:hypothetical protein
VAPITVLTRRLGRSGVNDPALQGALLGGVFSLSAALVASEVIRVESKTPIRPTRLESRIIDALVERPRRPSSLADEFGVHQSGVSGALRSLREKGSLLGQMRRHGRQIQEAVGTR